MSGRPSDDLYLIWSNEHGKWWGPSHTGYTTSVKNAGPYSREAAICICATALPGLPSLTRMPEIPVRLGGLREIARREYGYLLELPGLGE